MGYDILYLMQSELVLILMIFFLLILKIRDRQTDNTTLLYLVNGLLIGQTLLCFLNTAIGDLFSGMFRVTPSILLWKAILSGGTLIISMQSFDWLKRQRNVAEFYMLMLSTLLGMFYMISSRNFLMFYLGLELSAIPLAALVNFDLHKRSSSEGAMKMILSSAFISGIMLFGISILYGVTGTVSFDELPALLSGRPLEIIALVSIFAGFAFKLSAVPFHFWTADVYEGAPVPVTSYLSVISKAAGVFVLISVLSPLFSSISVGWTALLDTTIILTILIGNLFAIRQTNFKRFLAFSSITQVGYILLGLTRADHFGYTSAVYFLIVYVFSNLGIFGVLSLINAHNGREQIDEFRGLHKTHPVLAWVAALSLFSLAGIPPTAGFFGKMFLVTSGAATGQYVLITFAALNMVISLYYYLRVVRVMFVDESQEPMQKFQASWAAGIGLALCFAGIIATGFAGRLYDMVFNTMNI